MLWCSRRKVPPVRGSRLAADTAAAEAAARDGIGIGMMDQGGLLIRACRAFSGKKHALATGSGRRPMITFRRGWKPGFSVRKCDNVKMLESDFCFWLM
jgi:hypothetical protein